MKLSDFGEADIKRIHRAWTYLVRIGYSHFWGGEFWRFVSWSADHGYDWVCLFRQRDSGKEPTKPEDFVWKYPAEYREAAENWDKAVASVRRKLGLPPLQRMDNPCIGCLGEAACENSICDKRAAYWDQEIAKVRLRLKGGNA